MQNSTLDRSFVDKLKQILSDRYGKNLHIRQLMDLSNASESGEVYTRGQDLYIPIQVKGNLLGTAIVPSANDLKGENRSGVAQLVRMVLEPAMYKWYLDQRKENLEVLNNANFLLGNIHLLGDRKKEKPVQDIPKVDISTELISHLIHLEGSSEKTNKKVALQLHEITGRWAFVPFNDIKGQLHSSMDISRLGEMSIYIENIENLNSAEQELLMDYITDGHFPDDPIIITSSLKTINELEKSNLDPKFVDEVSVNCFEVDRAPLGAEALKEVLELLFIKDSGDLA